MGLQGPTALQIKKYTNWHGNVFYYLTLGLGMRSSSLLPILYSLIFPACLLEASYLYGSSASMQIIYHLLLLCPSASMCVMAGAPM